MLMIELKNLCKTYGRGNTCVHAVRNVSLKVNDGGFLAIMGASGSGKTTLMNILGCLDTPTKGEYFFAGTDVRRLSGESKDHLRSKSIGFIFQSFYLLPSLNARQNVELPMVYAGIPVKERHKRANELLEMTGLGARANHMPNEMSGGQRQRVAIARALVNSPSLVLADEPTGNLDTRTGEDIMRMLKAFNDRGTTIVLITHERSIANYAKELVMLKDGRIVAEES